jgi:uncharacterized protein YjbI with pentapeptide repeats
LLSIRLGAIYALERIARDSERDHWPIVEILTAYVREKAPWPVTKSLADDLSPVDQPERAQQSGRMTFFIRPTYQPGDIQAALTVLGRRDRASEREEQRLDLRHTDLREADLRDAHLERALLTNAHLEEALLQGAHLEGAYFFNAHLESAVLEGAYLRGATLTGAFLQGAVLKNAHLEGAKFSVQTLRGAILSGAYFDHSQQEEIRRRDPKLWEEIQR